MAMIVPFNPRHEAEAIRQRGYTLIAADYEDATPGWHEGLTVSDLIEADLDAGRDLRDPEAGARDWISAIRRNRVHAALGIAAGIAAACWMVGWL